MRTILSTSKKAQRRPNTFCLSRSFLLTFGIRDIYSLTSKAGKKLSRCSITTSDRATYIRDGSKKNFLSKGSKDSAYPRSPLRSPLLPLGDPVDFCRLSFRDLLGVSRPVCYGK